jgi:hypothetical protein
MTIKKSSIEANISKVSAKWSLVAKASKQGVREYESKDRRLNEATRQ